MLLSWQRELTPIVKDLKSTLIFSMNEGETACNLSFCNNFLGGHLLPASTCHCRPVQ